MAISRLIPEIRLPRVFDENLNFVKGISPIKMSVDLTITPLSYSTVQLPRGESLPRGGYVEVYTSMGSVGYFRIRSPQETFGEDITVSELEHAIVEVGDYIVRATISNQTMTATQAFQTIWGHYRGSKWQLGDISALGNEEMILDADHENVLEMLLSILGRHPDCMMSFAFNTSPWTVSVVQRGTTVEAEGRLSRNIKSAKVVYDDSELVTRCFYKYGQSSWGVMNASTIGQYGVVERVAPIESGLTQEQAQEKATVYMEKHKRPKVSVTLQAEDLSAITGEPLDAFSVGKLCRLALPEYNVIIERVITEISWDDVYDSPESITVTLEDEEDAQ